MKCGWHLLLHLLLPGVTLPDPDGVGGASAPEYSYTFDAVGNLLSETDPLGNVTSYDFDNLYRLTSVTQPDPDGVGGLGAPVTTFTHDAVGNRTSLTDPVGNTTVWVFDNLDRVIEETNELNDTRYFSWDAAGNLVEKTDRNGRVTEFDYDNLHRRVEERWMDGMSVVRTFSYEWDAAGQLVSADDPDSDYQYTYNGLGQVTQIDIDNGGPIVVLTQAFDAAGNRTSLAAEVDSTADFLNTYTFDNLHRMIRVTQEGQSGGNTVAEKRVDVAYFADSRIDTITRYNDLDGDPGDLVAQSEFTYDGLGRLSDLVHSQELSVINAFAWTYDAASRVTQFNSSEDGTSDYSYDHTSQLIAVDHSFQADETYEFDLNGNRVMAGYDIGDNNQLLSDGTWDYDYDSEGNTVLKTRISTDPADDYTVEYTWDHRNRLTSVVYKDNYGVVTMSAAYAYDVFDRRVVKSVDADGAGVGVADVTQFIYDGVQVVLTFDDAGSLKNRYLAAIDQVFADEDSSNDVRWSLTDNLGTVRDLVDNYGDVINHLAYSSFGAITSETNPTDFLFAFAGSVLDRETGDQYHWHRYYGSDIGAWRSPDWIGFLAGDTNLGRYVGNSPTGFVDRDGFAGRKVGDYTVTGKGHHIIPVSLWKEFGFAPEVYEFLDTYRLIDADTHSYLGHGTKTGYTGFLQAELRERLTEFMADNPDRMLSVTEQKAFIKMFIDDVLDGRVKRKYICEFNSHAAGGIDSVQKWLTNARGKFPTHADEVAPIAIKGIRAISPERLAKLLAYLGNIPGGKIAKRYLPLISAIATYELARANGNNPAEAAFIAGLEEINPCPVGYEEIHAAGEAYQGAIDGALKRNKSRMQRTLDIQNGGPIPTSPFGE